MVSMAIWVLRSIGHESLAASGEIALYFARSSCHVQGYEECVGDLSGGRGVRVIGNVGVTLQRALPADEGLRPATWRRARVLGFSARRTRAEVDRQGGRGAPAERGGVQVPRFGEPSGARRLQTEKGEAAPVVEGHPPEPRGDVLESRQAQDRDREVAQRSERLWRAADAGLGAVLVERSIPHVVAAVLDMPVTTDVARELFGRGLLCAQVGNVVRGLFGLEVVAEVASLAVDLYDLGCRGKAELRGELVRDRGDRVVAMLHASVGPIVGLMDDRARDQKTGGLLGEGRLTVLAPEDELGAALGKERGVLALGVHCIGGDDDVGELESLEQGTECGDLVGLGVDVALGDGHSLFVGEDRDEVHPSTVVEPSATKGLAIERERVADRTCSVLATCAVLVVIAALVFFDHDREVDLDRVFGLQSTGRDLGCDPGVDDQVEAVGVDGAKRAADRRLLGRDAPSGPWRDPAAEATERLFWQFSCELADGEQARRSPEGRKGRDGKDLGQLVADASAHPRVGHLCELVEQARKVETVEIGCTHWHPSEECWWVEVRGEQSQRVSPQRLQPVGLLGAVVDETSRSPAEPRGRPEQGEVRCLVAGAEVAGGIGERLDGYDRVAPARLEVRGEPVKRLCEHLGGEVLPAVLVEHAGPLVVRQVTQPAVALLITPGEELLSWPHAERGGSEADERDPVAVLLGDLAHDLADEPGAEPVLCGEGLVEAGALVGQDRADAERARRHPPSCSRGSRRSVSTLVSAQVRASGENFAEALVAGWLQTDAALLQ